MPYLVSAIRHPKMHPSVLSQLALWLYNFSSIWPRNVLYVSLGSTDMPLLSMKWGTIFVALDLGSNTTCYYIASPLWYVIDAHLLELLGLTSGGMPEEKTVTCALNNHLCFAHSLVVRTFTCAYLHGPFLCQCPFSCFSHCIDCPYRWL